MKYNTLIDSQYVFLTPMVFLFIIHLRKAGRHARPVQACTAMLTFILCFPCALQLLEDHPSILKLMFTSEGARRLLIAPFNETSFKSDAANKQLLAVFKAFVAENLAIVNEQRHHLCLVYLGAANSALAQRPALLHGDIPGQTSEPLFSSTLTSIDMRHAIKETPIDSPALSTSDSLSSLREALGNFLARVAELPLLPGEAAKLVRSWGTMGFLSGTQAANMVHPALDLAFTMSYTLLGSQVSGCQTSTTNYTPASVLPEMSWEQLCTEFLEAVYQSGVLRRWRVDTKNH